MNQKKSAQSTDEATESTSPSYPRIYLVLNPAAVSDAVHHHQHKKYAQQDYEQQQEMYQQQVEQEQYKVPVEQANADVKMSMEHQ